ncbi:TPA: hypothetical protein N0F65_005503, partial [Lagenidium giganteum]
WKSLNCTISLITYGTLELVSIVALQVLLTRSLRLSRLHLLAFVWEKQAKMVQLHLLLWFSLSIAINMMLHHFGADYSFQFAWLSQPHAS